MRANERMEERMAQYSMRHFLSLSAHRASSPPLSLAAYQAFSTITEPQLSLSSHHPSPVIPHHLQQTLLNLPPHSASAHYGLKGAPIETKPVPRGPKAQNPLSTPRPPSTCTMGSKLRCANAGQRPTHLHIYRIDLFVS